MDADLKTLELAQDAPRRSMQRLVRPLPCFPCPHNSVCCRWGTYLSDKEATDLLAEFGESFVYWNTDDKEWRTQVKNGRCAFWDGGCKLHAHNSYPKVCRIYPWSDGRDAELPVAHDASMCPSFVLPNA